MNKLEESIRASAHRLLACGEVDYLIGWQDSWQKDKAGPCFVFRPEDCDKLVFHEHCLSGLAKYLLDERDPAGKIGLCVRGCEARAVNRLLQDGQVQREQLYLLGIPCPGMREAGREAAKCQRCSHPSPVIYDELLGEPLPPRQVERFAGVEELEALSPEQRHRFWAAQYDKCIRCYACRNACPACNCHECYTDQYRTGWQGKQNNRAENQIYGMTRAFHVGDRCVECGECERVCPMNIPLMKLNLKLLKDIDELFGARQNGLNDALEPALGTFLKEDLDTFL